MILGMDLHYHKEVINNALNGLSFSGWAKDTILAGNVSQDSVYILCSDHHFDRKKKIRPKDRNKSAHKTYFYRSKNYLLAERSLILHRIKVKHVFYGRLALGRTLHTLTDFFAHSNFINLSTNERNQIINALKTPRDIPISEKFKLTYYSAVLSDKNDEYPHSKYKKENNRCRGFAEALRNAKDLTKIFMNDLKNEAIGSFGMKKWKKFRS